MKNTTKWMGIGCVGALLLSAAGAKASPINELVTNGDFEATPSSFGWTLTLGTVGSSFSGPVSGGGIDGSTCFAINTTSPDLNKLSQAIPTMSGQAYTLSFWTRHVGSGGAFAVLWNGFGVPSGGTYWNMGSDTFGHFTGTVYGGSEASTTLIFEGVTDGTGSYLIDNVSVTPVPEPAVLSLAALGGLMLLRKRRRG